VAKVAWLDCVNPHSSRVFSSGVALVDYVDGLGAAQESKSKSTRTTHSSELPWRLSSTALFSKSCSSKVHVSALKGSSLKPQAKSLSHRGSGVALLTAQSVDLLPWSMGVLCYSILSGIALVKLLPRAIRDSVGFRKCVLHHFSNSDRQGLRRV
jgi:hypothetical protein